MQFKSLIDSPCGLRYLFDNLLLQSGLSRRVLLETEMMHEADSIEQNYNLIRRFYDVVSKKENTQQVGLLQFKLCDLKDIKGTLQRLANKSVLDDIELFEIKHLALLAHEINNLLVEIKLNDAILIPDMNQIIEILDPDGLRMASFYIYDSYSEELKNIRIQLRKSNKDQEALFVHSQEIEDEVREKLVNQLTQHTHALEKAMYQLAAVDINLAKALQIQQYNLCFPQTSVSKTTYSALFNPEIREALQLRGGEYQNIDLGFNEGATIIIGANMGGKTVVLKTLTLCQYLYQFGFGIPAKEAQIGIQDEIYFCIGDEQSSIQGLSSFAAEMKRIDVVIKASRKQKKIMALIDEPARTTNPIEGTALVSALIKILENKSISLLITTHYNIKSSNSRRLRVKGLENGKMNYQLVEAHEGEVPHEALNIASELKIDEEWIACAKELLKDTIN